MSLASWSRSPLLTALVVSILAVAGGCGLEDASDGSDFPGIDVHQSDESAPAREVGVDARGDAHGDARPDGGYDADARPPEPARPPLELSLDERGPYNVGYRTLEVVYQAEADGTDEKRELDVSVWYPTWAEEGEPGEYFGFDREQVVAEAKPVALDSMPLLVFSHGNGGIAVQNYFMSEFWATRGWLIVSPSHTGNTLRSGTEINYDAAIYRPQDIRAVLDHILNLDPTHPLADKVAPEEIAMSGHSFGGFTTFANVGAEFAVEELQTRCDNDENRRSYCETFNDPAVQERAKEGFLDERIDIAIPQAPAGANVFQEGLADLQVPTMLMTGGLDQTLPNGIQGDPIWGYMKGPEHRRVHFPRAGHFTFSNMCEFMREYLGTVPDRIAEDGCGDQNIPSGRAHVVINTYALAFARYHFWGLNEPVVDGKRSPVGGEGFEYRVGAD